jgi:hypothetical protein
VQQPQQKKAIPFPKLTMVTDMNAMMQNSSNSSAPDFGEEGTINKAYKESGTLKTLVYALGKDSIVLRVTNLDDRFDN